MRTSANARGSGTYVWAAIAVSLCVPAMAIAEEDSTPSTNGLSAEFSPETYYDTRCALCHNEGLWAARRLAERVPEGETSLLSRSHLPAAYIQDVIRKGVGSMPAFTPTELSDSEVATLAAWLERPENGDNQ